MRKYVPDTSALFALIEDEEGATRVEDILHDEKVILPFVVLLEIYYVSLQEEGEMAAERRYATFSRSNILWTYDEATMLTAAHLKASHHISFADAMIAAVAIQHGAILIHKDPEYEALDSLVEMEILPYKHQ